MYSVWGFVIQSHTFIQSLYEWTFKENRRKVKLKFSLRFATKANTVLKVPTEEEFKKEIEQRHYDSYCFLFVFL